MIRFRASSQNVKALPPMPQHHVVDDVRSTADVSGIIGWQEIHLDRYIQAVKDLRRWETYFPSHGGAPISWRRRIWEFVDGGQVLLHPAEARVCLRRDIVWVKLRHRRTGQIIVVTNRHYVPSAWSWSKPFTRKHRQRLWNTGNARDVALVEHFLAQGCPVIGFGDYNSKNRRRPAMGARVSGRRVHYAVPDGSIDQIWMVAPEGFVWTVLDDETFRRHSDHDGRQAVLELAWDR